MEDVGRSLAASLLGDVDLTVARSRTAPVHRYISAPPTRSDTAPPNGDTAVAPVGAHVPTRPAPFPPATNAARARPHDAPVDEDVIELADDENTSEGASAAESAGRTTGEDAPTSQSMPPGGHDDRPLGWAADLMSSLPWDTDEPAGTTEPDLPGPDRVDQPRQGRPLPVEPRAELEASTGGRAPDPPRVIVIERSARSREAADDDAPTVVRSVAEWALIVGAALGLALLVQAFAFRIYEIPSESMAPTLESGDRVIVNKLSYTIAGDVGRGDVVVFDNPERSASDPASVPELLIKRVVGLPGDVVSEREGMLYVNDVPVDEAYLAAGTITNNLPESIVVPAGYVFVLGDNRERSHDGRYFGPIDDDTIVGRATTIVWPVGRFGML